MQSGKIDCQTVILAGGLGTRMRPVTETIPKPMIAVCSKPFLEHQLELLRRNGIDRVLLLVSYLGEQIEQYFRQGDSLKMKIDYSYESSPLGTGGALKNASEKLEEKLKNYFKRDKIDYGDGKDYIYYDYQSWTKDNEKNYKQLMN